MGPHQATRRTCRLTWPFQAGSSTYPGIDGMPFGGRLKGSRVRTLAARLLYSVAMSAPRVGDVAPEIVLSDSTGEKRSLSSLTPCVLIFYRGHW